MTTAITTETATVRTLMQHAPERFHENKASVQGEVYKI